MAFQHFNITLTGAAQNVLQTITGVALTDRVSGTGAAQDPALRMVSFQLDGAATGPCFIGGSSAVSSTSWGWRIPAPVAGLPAAPLISGEYAGSGPLRLSDFWVIGTATNVLHVAVEAF